jgi:hypothetical protein
MANYVLWTRHGKRGVVMEENEDEADDNNIPDWAAGQDFADTFVGHTPRVLMQGRRKSRRRTPTRIPLYSY